MALYIEVIEYPTRGGKNEQIFLTNQYTREELAEKLQPLVEKCGYSQKRLEKILSSKTLEEACTIQLEGTAIVRTQKQNSCWKFGDGDELTIYPDGKWDFVLKLPFWKRVKQFFLNLLLLPDEEAIEEEEELMFGEDIGVPDVETEREKAERLKRLAEDLAR